MSASVVGIVFNNLAARDSIKHFVSRNHAIRMHHLPDRVWKVQYPLLSALTHLGQNVHTLNPVLMLWSALAVTPAWSSPNRPTMLEAL